MAEFEKNRNFFFLKKKSKSLASGNWAGEIFLSFTHPHIVECVSEYVFINKKKKKEENKKQKQLKKKENICRKSSTIR